MMKQEQTTSTLKRLIQVTRALVSEKGCQRTTLQDVMERSGMSKGGIYHYVSGKDELLGLVLKEHFEETNLEFNEAVSAAMKLGISNGPFEILASRMAREGDPGSISDEIYLYLVSHRAKPTVRKILEDLYQHQRDLSARWIHIGQQSGAIPASIDIEQTITILQALNDGIRIRNAIVDPSDRVESAFTLDVLTRLLVAPTQYSRGENGHGF